jgi:predicted DNA-binding protein
MHMSALTRRTQILLDEERHRRLEEEASQTGRSVASIIREAIDLRLGEGDRAQRRVEAGRRLLASVPPEGDAHKPDWEDVEGDLYDERWRRMYGDDA